MQQVPLSAEPNQDFSITLDGITYAITLRALEEIMLITLTVDDVPLLTNAKCFANQPLILYSYLAQKGNFIWITADNNYPYYTDFNSTCFLYYVSAEEMKGASNG